MSKKNCPICANAIYAIDQSDKVCKRHLDYLILTCQRCRKHFYCSRDLHHDVCPDCKNAKPVEAYLTLKTNRREYPKGHPDPRMPLRKYGLEDSD